MSRGPYKAETSNVTVSYANRREGIDVFSKGFDKMPLVKTKESHSVFGLI
jgi:hypothetical protein